MNVKNVFGKVGFALKKNSPEILLGVGIISGVSATVLACRATLKIQPHIDVVKEGLENIQIGLDDETMEYTEQDAQKDKVIFYVQCGMKIAREYAPAAILGALSIGCVLESHKILRKRMLALGAAYAALDTGFRQYQARVADKYGVDVEKEIRYGVKTEVIEEVVIDSKGKEKIVKKEIKTSDGAIGHSPYARFFEESNENWEKDSEYNMQFLLSAQNYFNDLLKARGHVFLNEVYDRLGIPRTKVGQVVGWLYDTDNAEGDNYIDFGIFNTNSQAAINFVNGYERVILLDFNVDGNIWDKDFVCVR